MIVARIVASQLESSTDGSLASDDPELRAVEGDSYSVLTAEKDFGVHKRGFINMLHISLWMGTHKLWCDFPKECCRKTTYSQSSVVLHRLHQSPLADFYFSRGEVKVLAWQLSGSVVWDVAAHRLETWAWGGGFETLDVVGEGNTHCRLGEVRRDTTCCLCCTSSTSQHSPYF